MARKQRIDSASAAVTVMQAAYKQVSPPSHVVMTEADKPFWRSVVAEFPKAEWTDHQMEVAAQLAKAMADLASERETLRAEGYVLTLGGKQVANPRHGVARDLANSCMSLRRNLSLHARATQGEARDAGKRRSMAKAIEAELDDDLLARPAIQ